jgi:RimJ/RimL family protein N-acetyltransferase
MKTDPDPTPEVQILPISERCIEGYHACLDEVARERLYLGFVEAPPLHSTREFVRRIIAEGIPQFVALLDDRVVGWCDVIPMKMEGFTHSGELGMGLRRAYRGRGIGRRLLHAALAAAQELGLERVELEVFASNTPAVKLYESEGFEIEGVKKKARFIDGKYDDLLMMAKFI